MGVINGDSLTLQGVLGGGADVAQDGGIEALLGAQNGLDLDLGSGLTVRTTDGQNVGVHIGTVILGVGRAALNGVAPLAPGHPAGPLVMQIHIGANLDFHGSALGRIGAPAGDHVLKSGHIDLFGGPGAFQLAFCQTDGAVANLGGNFHILHGALVPGIGGGDAHEVVLQHVAKDVGFLGSGNTDGHTGAQGHTQQHGNGVFQMFHGFFPHFYVLFLGKQTYSAAWSSTTRIRPASISITYQVPL